MKKEYKFSAKFFRAFVAVFFVATFLAFASQVRAEKMIFDNESDWKELLREGKCLQTTKWFQTS